jgi:DNA-binding transcriptional ArsR family regulator
MTDFPFAPASLPAVQVCAALETTRNQLLSLWALSAEAPLAVDSWITKQAVSLSPAQRQFNRLLFAAFGAALLPAEPDMAFARYLDDLAAQPITQFHQRLVQATEQLVNAPLRAEARALLHDPSALRRRIIAHLQTLWDERLASEWQRHTYQLAGMTKSINELVFQQPRWQAINGFAALRFLLQAEPSDEQLALLAGVRRIVLVFSPHLLAYCTRFGSGDTLWVVRKFDPQLLRRDPLSRAEVLGPLNALADDTRLRILEWLSGQGEQRAQEIIAQLESSQGNISRHLKQLVGAGYVRQRRAGDANKLYEYDEAGLRRLSFLLRQLLSSENARSVGQQHQAAIELEQVRATVPPILHDLLDARGRIIRWSSKLRDQEAMMEYLINKFEPERSYSEKEVNELLQQWYLDADYVLLRRSMIDAGMLKRTRDGFRYWRPEIA